jgi:CTP synthase (UTP-ammonia lyase)
MNMPDAAHAALDPTAVNPLITPVSCPVPAASQGAPKLSGKLKVKLLPDTRTFRIYGRPEIEEEFFCNFELNPALQDRVLAGDLKGTGFGEHGEARVVELRGHRFFLATGFLPQLASQPGSAHPLITAFLAEAGRFLADA